MTHAIRPRLHPSPIRRWLPRAWILIAVASACALAGRPVRVLPEVTGTFVGGELPDDAELLLVLMHRQSAPLHARRRVDLSPEGHFRFEPVLLEVAGQEFGMHYRVYLHLRSGGFDRVIWRTELSRLLADAPIPLDCDLARPVAVGEICRVRNPLHQPWLLAEGEKSFERLCASCHGADGRGKDEGPSEARDASRRAPPLDLTQISARHGGHFDPDRVAASIEGRLLSTSHAGSGMPVWGERLSNDFKRYAEGDELIGATLDPIVAYLESLQVVSSRPSRRED